MQSEPGLETSVIIWCTLMLACCRAEQVPHVLRQTTWFRRYIGFAVQSNQERCSKSRTAPDVCLYSLLTRMANLRDADSCIAWCTLELQLLRIRLSCSNLDLKSISVDATSSLREYLKMSLPLCYPNSCSPASRELPANLLPLDS